MQTSSDKTLSVGVFTELFRGDVYFWQSLIAAVAVIAFPVAFVYNLSLDRFVQSSTVDTVKG